VFVLDECQRDAINLKKRPAILRKVLRTKLAEDNQDRYLVVTQLDSTRTRSNAAATLSRSVSNKSP
jgi:hypothetical protein